METMEIRLRKDKKMKKLTPKARAILARLNDARHRNRVLEDFNRSNTDQGAPVGGDQAMKVLEEMNEFSGEVEDLYRDAGEGLHSV